MSEYREQCNKRHKKLHTKLPELDKVKCVQGRQKKDKPVRLMCKASPENTWKSDKKLWCFGHYATLKGAEQSLRQKQADQFYSKYYEFWIEGQRQDDPLVGVELSKGEESQEAL